jgi:hypothetical protein
MRRFLTVAVTAGMVAWLATSCSSGPTTFSVTGSSVDPTYWCPGGAKDAPYNMHATIQAHNGTSGVVTIRSITAEMTLASVTGSWLEKVGDHYDAGTVTFDPDSVKAGSSATVRITIPSSCTSGSYGSSQSSSGTYSVTMRVTTSAGAYTVSARNQHQILAA